jgi:hypothetical protein
MSKSASSAINQHGGNSGFFSEIMAANALINGKLSGSWR